jgi:hypothetical protein
MNKSVSLVLKGIAIALAMGAALLASDSPSFTLDNHAVYQGF